MIVELEDGREFKLPDDTEEAKVDELVKALLRSESAAAAATAHCQALQAEVASLRKLVESSQQRKLDLAPLEIALGAVRGAVEAAGDRVEKAVLADTMLLADESGEYNRSRKVK